jgi:hypothetical protein
MTAPTTMLSETHERFLKAIIARIPIDRVMELHLFPPIKQGGMESGVAVIAVIPESEDSEPWATGSEPHDRPETLQASTESDVAHASEPTAHVGGSTPPLREIPLEALTSDDELPAAIHDSLEDVEVDDEAPEAGSREEAIERLEAEMTAGIEDDDVERLEDAVEEIEDQVEDPAAQAMAVASLEIGDLAPVDDHPVRYIIYSARYRLVLKGPERGRWEISVTAEADAPLVTVETVVRGVQRRSGDVDEVGRWTGDELRTALRLDRRS